MPLHATDRLRLAAALGIVGIVAAVLIGRSDIVLLVAPWIVLVVVGLTEPRFVQATLQADPPAERIVEGDTVPLEYRVNVSAPALIAIEPTPLQRHRDRQLGASVSSLAATLSAASPRVTEHVDREVTLDTWGIWQLGRTSVRLETPLGLYAGGGVAQCDIVVRVHPESAALRALVPPRATRAAPGTHTSAAVASGIEFADQRPWQPGDDLRHVNWRASARASELVVNQHHPDRSADVLLLIDSFTESSHDLQRVLTMVVQAATAASRGHLGVTDRVGLVELGGLIRWVRPGVGDRQLHHLVDALLSTSLHENAADKQLPQLASRPWSRRSSVIALTPLLDKRFSAACLDAKRQGHDVVVIECVAYAAADIDDASVTSQLAFDMYELERRAERIELGSHGIDVVRWLPGEPPALAFARAARARNAGRIRRAQ